MPSYTGNSCPICGKLFETKDDIVVCPICGSPHHRACYKAVGSCGNEELHAQNKQWEPQTPPPQEERQTQSDAAGVTVCRGCGTKNPPQAFFCQSCGARLSTDAPPQGAGFSNAFSQADMFTRVMGQAGLEYDQVLDQGVTVREAFDFVGPNALPFVMKFKKIATGGGMTFNWCAFFFGYFYCFYRKMYKLGALLLGITLLLIIPTGYYSLVAIQEMLNAGSALTFPLAFVENGAGYRGLLMMSGITRTVSFCSMVFCGFFFDRLYYSRMLGKIRRVKDDVRYNSSITDRSYAIAALGRVNASSILIVMAVLFGIYMLIGYVGSYFLMI